MYCLITQADIDDTSISCEQKLNKCGKANEPTQILPEMCGTV